MHFSKHQGACLQKRESYKLLGNEQYKFIDNLINLKTKNTAVLCAVN